MALTRIVHACVLLEVGGQALLTDPCLAPHWPLQFSEPVARHAAELPPLAAILGGHRVPDHWQPRSLRDYPHRRSTPVFVTSRSMARAARRAGFTQIEVLRWGDERDLGGGVRLRCLPGEHVTGLRTNAWLVDDGEDTVYVATEVRGLEAIRSVAARHEVTIAVLPVNGARLFGRQLVMDAATAVDAARVLGARVLVPIHDAQTPVAGLFTCTSGIHELTDTDDLRIEVLPVGHRAELTP